MLKMMNQTDIKSFNSVRKEFPYSRILMRINTLDDCEKLHEFLDKDMLCVIVGSYVQGGNQNVMYSVR